MSTTMTEQELADFERQAIQIVEHLAEGGTFGDLLGLDEKDYEVAYAMGHGLYGQGRYEDATKVFAFLVANNPFDRRFQIALGAALQVRGEYQRAVGLYTLAIALDMSDPVPLFHLAECLAALGQRDDAAEAFETVAGRCKAPEHQTLKSRALMQAEILRARVDAPGAS